MYQIYKERQSEIEKKRVEKRKCEKQIRKRMMYLFF